MKILRGFAYTLAASFLSVSLLYAAGRTGLLNSYLQSDLDAMDNTSVKHFIINLAGIQAPQSNMIYVDSNSAVGHDSGVYIGVRGTTFPFATLSAAHTAASDGDHIVMRGSPAAFSTGVTISKNRLTIDAYGVKWTATDKTNLNKLNITGADVTVNGLEIDGLGSPERTLTDVVLNSTATITSATGAFTSADVGRLVVFRNQKNAYAGNVIASVTNSTTIVVNGGIGSTKTGVNMEIWRGDANQGLIEVTGARCHLNELYLHDYTSHLIRPGAGSDGLRITKCRFSNGNNAVNGANYSANTIYDVEITGCTASRNRYDSYRLSTEGHTGTAPSYQGCKINGNTSRDVGNFGVELYGAETACKDCSVDGNYFANNGLGAISMASTSHSSASNNHISGFYGTGIEWAMNSSTAAAESDNTCNNNVIDEANEDGTYQDTWATGTSGLSISSNATTFDVKLKVQGNTIVVPNGYGINARAVYGIYCDGNYTKTGLSAYNFYAPASDEEVKNAYAELINSTGYGIWAETSGQNSTGFHYKNNRFVRLDSTSGYPLYQFYSGDGAHTISDVVIDGTRTNMAFGGSGFWDAGGNTVNFTSRHDNMPQATYNNGQVGIGDIQSFYDLNVAEQILVGDSTATSTATPRFINFGGTFSSVAGNHLKAILFDGGDGGGPLSYGLGISSNQMDFNVTTGASYHYYINGVEKASIGATGSKFPGTNTNDSASAGVIGEVASSNIASGSAVSLTTATAANVTSVSLTAGDWDVRGNVNFSGSSSTVTAGSAGISTTSATVPSDGTENYSGLQTTTTTETHSIPLPTKRVSLASTTTVYLVGKATFSAGTVSAFGSISARRVR